MVKRDRAYYPDTGKYVGDGPRIRDEFLKIVEEYVPSLPKNIDSYDVESILHRCVAEGCTEYRWRRSGLV